MKKPIPFGKYLLLDRVNVGGMAEVFKGKLFGVEGFERMVALKRILPSIAEDQEFITMFIDEAKIAVQLTHANIAQIFDLGKVADSYFIAMEYVHGKDLRAIFDRARKRGETVPVPMACYTIMKVCEGLDYAHNKKDPGGTFLNLVHRDVSPQNVLISHDGEVKLIDFGIAKAANKAGKTQAGILKGKFGYMSPEQVRGLPLDRRSDIFAVGIVLYELLTGERLFVGESDFSTLEKVRNVDIMPPSTYNRRIPEELEQIVLKALAKDVEDRYQTAMDLHDDLQSFMYTSGNFFARKDLSGHMRKAFSDEIARDSARDEEYRKAEAASAQGSGLDVFDDIPPASRAASLSNQSPRMTLQGVGALPPAPPVAPMAPSVDGMDMDWDDDELATQIYDKPPIEAEPSPQPFARGPAPSVPPPQPPARASVPPPPPPGPPRPGSLPPPPPSRPSAPSPLGAPGGRPPSPPGVGPSLSQPGMGAPGPYAAQPGMSQPGMSQPGMSQPGMSQPGMSQPGMSQPGMSQPEFREPTAVTAAPAPAGPGKSSATLLWGAVAFLLLAIIGAGAYLVFAPSAPGVVSFTTVPNDPSVFFDEHPVAATSSPFVLSNVESGRAHLLEVRREGFVTYSTRVELAPGQSLPLGEIILEPEARAGAAPEPSVPEPAVAGTGFTLASAPPGATVIVDGQRVEQTTPVQLTNLTPGSHTVRVEAGERFAPWETQIQVVDRQIVALPLVTLEAQLASVRFVSTPPGAEVVLRQGRTRRALGSTPLTEDVSLAGGEWTVEMSRRGYQSWSEALVVPAGQAEVTVEATLDPSATGGRMRRGQMMTPSMDDPGMVAAPSGAPGTLRINSRPWSQVSVDGRRVGNTPQMNISLSPGRHSITLVNPDFNLRQTITVNIESGQTLTRIVTLSP